MQRALVLALSGIEVGGEISVTTRMDGEAVLFEIESRQVDEPRLDDRAATLSEFVETLGGRCQIDSDGRSCCLIAMELRPALVTDG